MGSQSCMNERCGAATSPEWKSGWQLKSGGSATLCLSCGVAYEKSTYCSTFHLEEDGWRECRFCKKRVHCGCSASKTLIEILDFGGVGCANCVRKIDTKANANATSLGPVQVLTNEVTKVALAKDAVGNGMKRQNVGEIFLRLQQCGTSGAEEFSVGPPYFTEQPAVESMVFARPKSHGEQRKELYEGPSLGRRPSLNISLGSHLHGPFLDALDRILSIPPKHVPGPSSSSEASRAGIGFQRVSRPPAEGRGRCHLLPRYWPRITEQELQQISGNLKSPIVPLFEKVLTASDAGRIGRLILPKACAEAYFPPIDQSEGIPINIQDVTGREWTFQFRFWPNNNSRMYVLEGVTPCIQTMSLQAGDTVTFSRRDPGGQLVMGFRKSTSNIDASNFAPPTLDGSPVETCHSGPSDDVICLESDKMRSRVAEESLEKKKARNLGTKNKLLHMHDDDVVELRVTWEEAQELLRPPPMNNPTIVKIDNNEFEEYNEPPVFGKKTVFTTGPSGQQEQWTQCDNCEKWRKLPVHVLVPAKWTCPENEWDTSRASCLAPDVINPQEQEALLIASRDKGRRKGSIAEEDFEPSGLDALATTAVLGDNVEDLAESATTTRHPRHRV